MLEVIHYGGDPEGHSDDEHHARSVGIKYGEAMKRILSPFENLRIQNFVFGLLLLDLLF